MNEPVPTTSERVIVPTRRLRGMALCIQEWQTRLKTGGLSSAKPQDAAPTHQRNTKLKRPYRRPPVYDIVDDLADLESYYALAQRGTVEPEVYDEMMRTYHRLLARLR